jgi:ankyrin repeat protein
LEDADSIGWSALLWASSRGRLSTVQLLIERGADIRIKNKEGKTAMDCAREKGHKDIVTLLEAAIIMV